MFYLTMLSTHFIDAYKVLNHSEREDYSFQLMARDPLYAPSHRWDSTYRNLCYISLEGLAETRNSSMGPP